MNGQHPPTLDDRISYLWADDSPPLPAPNGRPLICHIALNLERWPLSEPAPRSVLPAPHGARPAPDVPNITWAEYGMRCGMPRILRLLEDLAVPVSVMCNADAAISYKEAVGRLVGRGHEFVGHGLHQQALPYVLDEQETIRRSLDILEKVTGRRPRGWLGPGLQETPETLDHLAAAGIEFVCDWLHDDQPTFLKTSHGPVVAVPYTVELNDSVLFAVGHHSAVEFDTRLQDTLVTFETELGPTSPRVLTIALHPHLIGAPHRIGILEVMLERLRRRSDTVFMTGGQISDWFRNIAEKPA